MYHISIINKKPETPSNLIVVYGESDVTVLNFVLAKEQEDIDFSTATPSINYKAGVTKHSVDAEHIALSVDGDNLNIAWTLSGIANGDIYYTLTLTLGTGEIWKSAIGKIRVSSAINA